jgi:DNA replication protein DnaC
VRTLQTPRTLTAEDLQRANIPEEFWRTVVDRVPDSARPTISAYLANLRTHAERGAGLLLWGDQGTGKTAAATLILRAARAWGCSAFFTSVFDLREAMRARTQHDDASSVFDRCREVDILVIDNLRITDANGHYVNFQILEDLFLARGSRLKVSILTTQISRKTLLTDYESFLLAMERYMVNLNFTGKDQRAAQSAALKALIIKPAASPSSPSSPKLSVK